MHAPWSLFLMHLISSLLSQLYTWRRRTLLLFLLLATTTRLFFFFPSFSSLPLSFPAASNPRIIGFSATSMMKTPAAKKVKHEMVMFGDIRNDDYYWLRDDSRSDPQVLSYLKEGNAYTDSVMEGTKAFEDQLFAEMKGRIKEDDISVPLRKGSYFYYERTLKGKEYVQHCRRLIADSKVPSSIHDTLPTGPDAPEEHVILDENINAQENQYYSIGTFKVSPNNKLVAYAEDTKGDEIYTAYVIDADTRTPVGKPLQNVKSNLGWAGDDSLVYVTMDEFLRPDKVGSC